MIALYSWDVDSVVTATVSTSHGIDFRVLTPYADIMLLEEPVPLTRVKGPGGRLRPMLDFIYGGAETPKLMSVKALRTLENFLRATGKVKQLAIEGVEEPYYAYTPTQVVDAIDTERSEIQESTYSRILKRPVFKPIDVDVNAVFVAKDFETQGVWVTENFVQAANAAGLTGAIFTPVGTGDLPPPAGGLTKLVKVELPPWTRTRKAPLAQKP